VLASTPTGSVVRLEWVQAPRPDLRAAMLRSLQRAAVRSSAGAAAHDAACGVVDDDDDDDDDTDEVDADLLRALLLDAPAEQRARVLGARRVRRAAARWTALGLRAGGDQGDVERAVMRLVEDEVAATAAC
jgi:hypothetical protein